MLQELRLQYLENLFSTEPSGIAQHNFSEVFELPNGEKADEAFLMFATESTVEQTIYDVGFEIHITFKIHGAPTDFRIRWVLGVYGETFLFKINGFPFPLVFVANNPRFTLLTDNWNLERCHSFLDYMLAHFDIPILTRIIEKHSTEAASFQIDRDVFFKLPESARKD